MVILFKMEGPKSAAATQKKMLVCLCCKVYGLIDIWLHYRKKNYTDRLHGNDWHVAQQAHHSCGWEIQRELYVCLYCGLFTIKHFTNKKSLSGIFPLRNHGNEMMADSNCIFVHSRDRRRKQDKFLFEATTSSFLLFIYNFTNKHYFVLILIIFYITSYSVQTVIVTRRIS